MQQILLQPTVFHDVGISTTALSLNSILWTSLRNDDRVISLPRNDFMVESHSTSVLRNLGDYPLPIPWSKTFNMDALSDTFVSRIK